MPKWLKRIVLRVKLWFVDLRLSEEQHEREEIRVCQWIALEEQDAASYDFLGKLYAASRRVSHVLQLRRDGIVSQLERL